MVNIIDLWLPILLSGLFMWIASGLIHMVLKYHNSDYKLLPNEEAVADSLGKSLEPGLYSIPHCPDMSKMQDEAFQKRFIDGPVAFVTIFPKGLPPMGKLLSQQFLYFVIGAFLVAYVATLAISPMAESMDVFRLTFIVGFLALGWGNIPYGIWYGHKWGSVIKYVVDAIIYAAITALTFVWLWPTPSIS